MTDKELDRLCETLRERILLDIYGNRDPAPPAAADAIAALRAEVAALRQDAARYRLVRDLMRIGPHGEWVAIIGDAHPSERHKREFDAAIDAALAAKAGGA